MGNQPSRREHARKPAGEKPFEKDARILIIGGGPSGVHMAHLLKLHGIENVTILEQSDEVGGKAKTLYTPESGDLPQDMGAVHLGWTFDRMVKLASEYGSELIRADPNDVSEVYCPELRKKQGATDPHKPISMLKYCFDQEEVLSVPKSLWCLPSFTQAPAILTAIFRYNKLHRKIFGVYDYGLPPPLDNDKLKMINMTFKKFLEANDLAILIPLLTLCFTFQGYGLMEEAPALYGLWWSTPALMIALLENKPLMQIQKLGMQHLFKNIVLKDGLKVVNKAKVLEINRNTRDRSKPVEVKALVDGEKQSFEADFIIIAIPAHRALEIMRDPTDQEKEVFATLQSKYVVSTLYSSKVIRPEEKGTSFYPELLTASQAGRRSGERITSRGMYPDVKEDPNGRRVAIGYQYYLTGVQDNQTSDYLQLADGKPPSNAQLIHDLEQDGHKDIMILDTCSFEYSPNFSLDAIHKGYPWKVLEFQGRNRTWYIGSSVSYESTEDVISYNHLLMKIFNFEE